MMSLGGVSIFKAVSGPCGELVFRRDQIKPSAFFSQIYASVTFLLQQIHLKNVINRTVNVLLFKN